MSAADDKHPYLPGDLLKVTSNGYELRSRSERFSQSFKETDERRVSLTKGDLIMLIVIGDIIAQGGISGIWRWHLFLHSRTGFYGWHAVQSANPSNVFKKIA